MKMKKKVLPLIAIGCVSLLVLGMFLFWLQGSIAKQGQQDSMRQKLDGISEQLKNADESKADIYLSFDEIYESKAQSAAYEAQHTEGFAANDIWAKDMCRLLNVTNVIVTDAERRVIAKAQDTPADFTRARFNTLSAVMRGGQQEYFGINYPTGENYTYFSAMINSDMLLIIEQDTVELDALQAETTSWAATLGNISVGMNGFAFPISTMDYSILYYPDADKIGSDALTAGIDVSLLEDGRYGYISLFGERYYAGVKNTGSAYIVCAVPESEINASRTITVGVVLFVFFAVMTVVIAYALLLNGKRLNKPQYKNWGGLRFDQTLGRKVGTVMLIGLVLIGTLALYMQSLFSLSRYSISNNQHALAAEQSLKRSAAENELVKTQYNRRYLNKAQTASYILARHPELAARDELARLSDVLDTEWISIFDMNGTITSTNSMYVGYTLSTDPTDQSYAFRSLLNGAEYIIQEPQADDLTGETHQYLGAALFNLESGSREGFVQIAVEPSKLESALAAMGRGTTLAKVKVGTAGFAFSVDKGTKNFTYYPDERLIGRVAAEYGIPDEALINGYNNYLTVNGVSCYAASIEVGTDIIYIVIPANEMNGSIIPVTLLTMAVSLLCLLALFFSITLSSASAESKKEAEPIERRGAQGDAMIDVKMPDGTFKKTKAVASRWSSVSIGWDEKSPEQQLQTLIRTLFSVLAIAICLAVIFKDSFFSQGSIFLYILEGGWPHGINIFAVTGALMEVCVIAVISMGLSKLLKALTKTLDARGETICRLLRSFVKYISVIVGLYCSLALLGVDTATLLASAGILSLVIGLGAQRLVSDVISGLFLIFEGDFQVGDIVTVGSWRGTVQEIGVRTTKIEDGAHNVKIMSNSEVTGIINMTRKFSYAVCDVGIEYGESLERVEAVLAQELPRFKERIPSIKNGPFYKGVTELGNNSVNIRIVAECSENDRFQLVRDLNREVKLVFDKHDIGIPFPQIVLNQPAEFKEATKAEKRKADAFSKEQGELTKDMVDTQG